MPPFSIRGCGFDSRTLVGGSEGKRMVSIRELGESHEQGGDDSQAAKGLVWRVPGSDDGP